MTQMRRLLAILMLAAAVLSCAADIDMSRPLSGGPVFSGRFDSKDAERCWSSGDIISLFIGTTYNHQYVFQGQNGATKGEFRETSTPVWLSQKTVAANYAVFPYSTSLSLTTAGDLMVSLPKLQHYAGGNPDQSSNIMVAATAEKTSKSLVFRNVCGYLKVRLFGAGVIESIILRGNNGEKISGNASVTADRFGGKPNTVMTDGASETITLYCEDGVALGKTEGTATTFCFIVPPVTFNDGITLTIRTTGGRTVVRSTAGRLIVESDGTTVTETLRCDESEEPDRPDEPDEPRPQGPEAVDMGLSVKWASFNVGATCPTELGGFYAWGETEEKAYYDWSNYKYCEGTFNTLTKYCREPFSYGRVDNKTTLEPEDDAATVNLGKEWRMPTHKEYQELFEDCICTMDTLNGIWGYRLTGPSGKSIFLPVLGYYAGEREGTARYWSSTLYEENPSIAYECHLKLGSTPAQSSVYDRRFGHQVRAVSSSAAEAVDLGLSVRWASCNLGADKEEHMGDYFAWGETEEKAYYNWSNYKYCEGTFNTLTKYCVQPSYGTPDGKTELEPEDDVAAVKWGGAWRMPDYTELKELFTSPLCEWSWQQNYGGSRISGFVVTSLTTGNSIFLPAAFGYWNSGKNCYIEECRYWSSSIRGGDASDSPYAYYFHSDDYSPYSGDSSNRRNVGLSVRPVQDY